MTAVGAWLAITGLCDLLRAGRDATPAARRMLLTLGGALLVVLAALALEAPWWLGVLWLAAFATWLQTSASALAGHGALARSTAFAAFAVGVGGSLLAGGQVGAPEADLPGALGGVEAEVVVVTAGVLLCQLATGNVLVRLLLDAVGVPASDNEKTLKGGRLLGPMERLMLVGLGLAGQVTAAGVVVAAKGLLRFPELQRVARESGPSDMSEYFLIGSFASWLLALGGVALVGLS